MLETQARGGGWAIDKKTLLPLEAPEGLSEERARDWYRERNFIVRPIVLITTVNKEGTPNVSVKTNFMTVGSMRRYAFCCSSEHHTYQNIVETGEFVINIATEDIVREVLKAAMITVKPCPPGLSEVERAGLTAIPSEKVRPPRIGECIAHYECVLDWRRGDLIVGRVVAASADESLMDGTDTRRPIVVRGGRVDSYAVVGEAKKWPKTGL